MVRISDNFWNEIKHIIPSKTTKIGRPSHCPLLVLSGVFFIMESGSQWRNLPHYYGKKSTVHRWFTLWVKQGVFSKILELSIDFSLKRLGSPECFIADTTSSKSPFAKFANISPVDRRKYGIKKSVIIDWNKIIFSIILDSANTHDSKMLLGHIPNIKKHIKEKTVVMLADSAFDVKKLRKNCIKNNIALYASTNVRRNKNKQKIYPKGRWKIEQVFGMQQWLRGIKFCWTKLKNNFLAFCQFAASIHNLRLAGILG